MDHGAELDSSSLRPHEVDVKTKQTSVAPSDIQEEVEQVRHRLCYRQTTTCRVCTLFHLVSPSLFSERVVVVVGVWRRERARGLVAGGAGSMTLDPDCAARLEAL